jgi:hypothetical protein
MLMLYLQMLNYEGAGFQSHELQGVLEGTNDILSFDMTQTK